MHRGQSLYLDFLRLIAALEVFAYHLCGLPNTGLHRAVWNDFGHDAVTVFFVLSGFVIPYAARSREPDPRGFAIARLTRIYSVAIPCLVLTYVFDAIGHRMDPALYNGLSPTGSALVRLGIGSVMLNEAWVSVQMLSNTPYWSISYEFWYYVIFSALFYLHGRQRIIGTFIAALIAGPFILLLFPIWLLGWLAYRERMSASWPKWLLWIAFVQPVAVLAIYYQFSVQRLGGELLESALGHELWWKHLAWSRYVLTDTLLGLSVALNLAASKNLSPALDWLLHRFQAPIRWGVARSFTLYLLHQPAILVVTALLSASLLPDFRGITIAAVALAIVAIVSQFTELKRNGLKPLVGYAIDLIWSWWTTASRKLKPSVARG